MLEFKKFDNILVFSLSDQSQYLIRSSDIVEVSTELQITFNRV